jgi:prepilin peptidase CpaA
LIVFDLVVATVTGLSLFFDLRVRRIPNWLILFGLGSGLILNLYRGASQFSYSAIGFLVGVGTFVIPFALGWIGAGDVKLCGVIGAMLGVKWLPRVLFYSAMTAGIIALASVSVGRYRPGFLKSAWIECKIAALSFGRILPESVNMRVSKGGVYSLPLGVALSVGTILAYFVDPVGHWAAF